MEVSFLNLKKAYTELKPELDQLWQDLHADSSYILGARLENFEREFSKYLGVKHVIGVANGLDALTLSLQALDIGVGHEVIVPAHTFIASWLAISETGAIPVPVEVDLRTYLLDPSKIESAITENTRAIMPVHLYGRLCDMSKISALAQNYHLRVIEDAAQAHGSFGSIPHKKAGSFGDAATFSFYPGKNLGCFGDGGCVATNDDETAQKLKLLRNYGSKIRYEHEVIGKNSRLDELQAGVLSIKLKHLDEWNDRRKAIAKIYLQTLQGVGDLVLPEDTPGHVWHIFPVLSAHRDALKKFLATEGIGTIIHYPKPIHHQEAYKHIHPNGLRFANTDKICATVLSLPMGPHLEIEEALFCVQTIKKFFE